MNKKILYITTALMVIAGMAAGYFMLKQAEKMSSIAKSRRQIAKKEQSAQKKKNEKYYFLQAGTPGVVAATVEKNGLIEISDTENPIKLPENSMYSVAEKTSRDPLLKDKPTKYYRFDADGMVFEWIVSSYIDEKNPSYEDAALIISDKENGGLIQSIKPKPEVRGGVETFLNGRFLFSDVNFDGFLDLLVNSGSHGVQMALRYYCFLNTGLTEGRRFIEAPEFMEILNPEIDAENKTIRSRSGNNGTNTAKEYKYKDGKFVVANDEAGGTNYK